MKQILFKLNIILFSLPLANAQDLPSNVPTQGLEAYYLFKGNANDASGKGHDGTVSGATLTADKDGNTNSAYSFDGVSNTIGFDSSFFNGQQVNSFTLFARFNVLNLEDSPNIWGKALFWGEVNFYLHSDDNSVNLKWANTVNGNRYSGVQSSNNSISNNEWIDVAITFENQQLKVYKNGVLINSTMKYSQQGGGFLSNTQVEEYCNFAQDTNSNKIGMRLTGGNPGNYFKGVIDDFGIWNRALTEQEIQNLYTSSAGDIILNGVVSAESNQIKNVADPTDAQDAVTMAYLQTKLDELSNRVKYLEDNVDVDCGVSYFEDFNSCDLTGYYAQGGNITSTSDGYEGCGVYMTHYAGQDPNNFYAIDKKFLYGVYELDAIADNGISDNIVRVLQQETLDGGYTFSFRPTNTDNPGWSVFNNGELIDSADAFPVARGSWYNIKIEVLKNSLKIWINDVVLFETDSITPPSDVPGYFKVGVAYSGAFDNLKFTPDSSSCK